MKLPVLLAILALSVPVHVHASCIVTPPGEDIAAAESVFVATITGASMIKKPSDLRDKEGYTIRYAFEVLRTFKGDPTLVSALTTRARFDDPADGVTWEFAEQTRLVPGDSVLVVASGRGDVPVSSIGYTSSRPWDSRAQRIVASVFANALG